MPSLRFFSFAALGRPGMIYPAFCPFIVVLLLSLAPNLDADVIETGVNIDHQLNFTDPYFADATWSTTLTITLAPTSSGSRDFSMLFYPYNNGLTFFSTGSVTIDQTSRPSETASAIVHVSVNGGGTFGFRESASWQELSLMQLTRSFYSPPHEQGVAIWIFSRPLAATVYIWIQASRGRRRCLFPETGLLGTFRIFKVLTI